MIDRCAFRLDDITPDMDWDRFYRIKAIFDKYKVKPLIGIVPDNQDPGLRQGEFHEEFWEYMSALERAGWQIAQHGYQHIYETENAGLLGLKKASEFAGLPIEEQYTKLKCGREILQAHGLHTGIFMAPGHTYDKNTIKALKKLGFTCVTDGYARLPYFTKGLLFVPCKSARPRLSAGIDTICIHCNELTENDYCELENFLEKYGTQVISFEEVIGQLWYPGKTPGIWLQEKKNLLLYKIKRRIAKDKRLQTYLQSTYDEDGAKKRRKRLLGLPGLLFNTENRKRRGKTGSR